MSFPSDSMNDHLPRGSDPVFLIPAAVFPKVIIEAPPGLEIGFAVGGTGAPCASSIGIRFFDGLVK